MRAVEVADIDKEIDQMIEDLNNDPTVKQSEFAAEVAKWGIERLHELREKIVAHSIAVSTRRYK